MRKLLLAAVFVLAGLALFGFAVQKAEACHATGGADCDGWWVNIVGPGDGWVLDHVVGDTSGTWQPGQTHVDYDVTAFYKKWVVSGYYVYTDRPTTPPVYDCDFTVNIHGTSYNVAEFYIKPTGDDHHCHRIVWGNLTTGQQNDFKAMHHNDHDYGSPNHGTWEGAYNFHIAENPNGHLVTPGGYGSCPAGYEVDPSNQAKCRQWVDTSHFIYESFHFTGTINRPDCYVPCSQTIDGTPSTWSPWELVDGVWTSTRTVPLLDSQNHDLVCGSRPETRTQNLCAETVAVGLPDTYSDWSPWVYDPKDGLEHSFQTVTHHSYLGDAIDPDHVCTPPADPEIVWRTREVEYGLSVTGTADCDGFEYLVAASEGAEISVEGSLTGTWTNLYGPESAPAPTVTATWPSGYSLTVKGSPETIDKPANCIKCRWTRLYPMATYLDPSAPPVYWQGPFGVGPGVCPVIHPEGQTPSAERVTVICSLCPNQYEGGFIYHGAREFIDDYVWRVDCYNGETHYYYAGFLWDQWVRHDFTPQGQRCSPYKEGCAAWIHENAK